MKWIQLPLPFPFTIERCALCDRLCMATRPASPAAGLSRLRDSDPILERVYRLLIEIHRRNGGGVYAGQIRDELGLKIGRTALYNRLVALREANLVALHGKRWLPLTRAPLAVQ